MTGKHEFRAFQIWRWLRRLFLLSLWMATFALGAGIWVAWHRFPGTFLGVGWVWFAGLAWIALTLMALDATIEVGDMPLPPEIPPDQEIRNWLLFVIAGPTVAAIFAFLVGIPLVASHWVLRTFDTWDPQWRGLILFTLWMAWLVGTLSGLAALQKQPALSALRRMVRQRLLGIHVTDAQILALLEACDLPPQIKTPYLQRIRRHGMTEKTALELLEALEAHPSRETPPFHRAQLAQALSNWLEEQEP